MEKEITALLSGENDKLLESVKRDPFLLRKMRNDVKTREICRVALESLSGQIPKYDLISDVPYSDVCLEILQRYCMDKTDAVMYAVNIRDEVMNEEIAEFILEKNPLAFPILKDTYLSPELCFLVDRGNPDYFSKYPDMLPIRVKETVNVFTLSRMLERRFGGRDFSVVELKEILQGKPFHIKEPSSGKSTLMKLEGGKLFIFPEEKEMRERKKGCKL